MDPYCQLSIFITGQIFMYIPQAAAVLLINPLDADDLIREAPDQTKTFAGLLYYASQQLCQPRAIRTPRQVKGVKPHPAYYRDTKTGTMVVSRGSFILRQSVILIWQYAVLDMVEFAAHAQPMKPTPHQTFTDLEWNVSFEVWIERAISNLVSWFLIARILIDYRYRLASILLVGLGFGTPEDWPPLFTRMSDAYTLRRFWGTFWHQFLRQPLTAFSNLIARDILHLPRPSVLERYTNIFLVFLGSALLHLTIDIVLGIPTQYSGAMPFFTTFTLAYMIEDGVQALYKRINGSENEENTRLNWKRIVGYLWVATWLGVSSTWYMYPASQRTPPHELKIVPFTVSERVGIAPVAGFAVIGGLGLLFGFKVEL
ncbi:hypothetical protein N7454_011103 [Penicillium verhagenii]|nr:hypothetical protein N7454_011103 [Penicillium verhagenii]